MSGIHVYNRLKEDYSAHPNNYYIGRSKDGNVLGNPYSHLPEDKCLALYRCRSREEAIERYSSYFDIMYSGNVEFRNIIDEIYEKYKSGEDVFLECFCVPEPCHGTVIAKKLEQRLIKEKINSLKNK